MKNDNSSVSNILPFSREENSTTKSSRPFYENYSINYGETFSKILENYFVVSSMDNSPINQKDEVMNNDRLLEKYMDKIDRDQSTLKDDIKASESRMHEHTSESEKRMEGAVKRIEENISSSEAKMDARLNRIEDAVSKTNENFVNETEKIKTAVNENKKFMIGILISIVAIVLATVIGMFTITQAFFNMQNASNSNLKQSFNMERTENIIDSSNLLL